LIGEPTSEAAVDVGELVGLRQGAVAWRTIGNFGTFGKIRGIPSP
jgi:hypothetical protein